MFEYFPYAAKLSHKLGIHVDHIGMSGWRVDQMVQNLESPYCVDTFGKSGSGLGFQLSRHKYNVCIIMAGTNDLAANRTADQILHDLKALHGYCHARGIRTIAVTIPESQFISEAFYRIPASMRRKVNRGLSEWASSMPDKALFVDMATQVPYSAFSGEWNPDGLHMTRQGYSAFGDRLGSLVRSFITGTSSNQNAPTTHLKATTQSGGKSADARTKWMSSGVPMLDVTNMAQMNGSSAFFNAQHGLYSTSTPVFQPLGLSEHALSLGTSCLQWEGRNFLSQQILW